MLSTRLRGETASHLSKIVIDTFVRYRRGTLPPTRVLSGPGARTRRVRLRAAIQDQIEALAVLELPTGSTFADELRSITSSAVASGKALLERPQQERELRSAEIRRLEAETTKLLAEARRAHAQSENVLQDAIAKRLANIARLREMAEQLDRDDALEVLDAFGPEPQKLLPPGAPG